MEAGIDAVANNESLSESLGNFSLDDGKNFVQDGDYVINDKRSLPFACKEVLGRGWSAVVEKVECLSSKEIYANKVITFPRKGKDREQAEERYRNEVAIIRSLKSHRHIVELFATYTTVATPRSGGLLLRPAADQGDLQYFLDQYSDAAENFATRTADLKQMDEVLEQAFGCLSSGLSYMHKRGVRHKDIKPGNILIHKGVVLYTDFGASKDTKVDGQCTTEGRPEFLTRRYCAPEVLEHDKRNFAADIFSLGCVFVEILLRLSRLTEYDDLEEDGYSGVMDVLHELLRSAKIQPKLSFLLDIVIPMTAREPLGRPASEEVVASICYHAGFSCSHCARVRPEEHAIHAQQPTWNAEYQRYFYTWWDGSNKLWYRTHYVEG
jgi:serine/threonine protein kinase